ncbi:MAG: hypothetical protein Q8910_00775 [Bacteroidota bacterium]|nr:hypothetical protein [Bacteroidota bacterium]
MKFYIDLKKGNEETPSVGGRRLHKERLIRRPVQVRGKNGKIYTRMQWVDPRTGMPANKTGASPEANPEAHHKAGHYDPNTRMGAVHLAVNKMSREEKEKWVKDTGITWKRNDDTSIDHKNKIVALKKHFHENPHLLGLEHLPAEEKMVDPEKQKVKEYLALFNREDVEDMIGDFASRGLLKWDHSDDKNILWMKQKTALGKLLVDKPELMKEYEPQEKEEKPTNKQEKMEHPIARKLRRIPTSDKWDMVEKYGIEWNHSDDDRINRMHAFSKLTEFLRKNPHFLGLDEDDMDEVQQWEDRQVNEDSIDKEVRGLSPEVKSSLIKQYGIESKVATGDSTDRIREVNELVKFFKDHPNSLKDAKQQQENHNLMNMKITVKQMMSFLRREMKIDPGEVRANKEDKEWTFKDGYGIAQINLDNNGTPVLSVVSNTNTWDVVDVPLKNVKSFMSKLEDIKEGVKSAPKYGIDDIRGFLNEYGYDVSEKLKKIANGLWKFKPDNEDVKGVVEVTPDGLKLTTKDKYGEDEAFESHESVARLIEKSKVPLHDRPINYINATLTGALTSKDEEKFDDLYKGKLKNRLDNDIRDAFNQLNDRYGAIRSLSDIHEYSSLDPQIIEAVANRLGFNKLNGYEEFNPHTEEFHRFMLGHLVTETKEGNASNYIKNLFGQDTSWALRESGRGWNMKDRAKARKEIISRPNVVPTDSFPSEDHANALRGHLAISTRHYPFDLVTQLFVEHGVSMKPLDNPEGTNKACYQTADHSIRLAKCFYSDDVISISDPYMAHPTHHLWDESGNITGTWTGYGVGHAYSHEMGHAVDDFFSGGYGDFGNWHDKPLSQKFMGKYSDGFMGPYLQAIGNHSNPGEIGVGEANGHQYYFHKDNFDTAYEGRIYGDVKIKNHNVSQSDGNTNTISTDGHYSPDVKRPPNGSQWGIEHWAESVGRTFSALHHYKEYMKNRRETAKYQEENGVKDGEERVFVSKSMGFRKWSKAMHDEFNKKMESGYFTQYNCWGELEKAHPDLTWGHKFMEQAINHPEMTDMVMHMINRPDYVEKRADPSSKGYLEQLEPRRKTSGGRPKSTNTTQVNKSIVIHL